MDEVVYVRSQGAVAHDIVRLDAVGAVRVLTFNRPEKRNAAGFALQDRFLGRLREVRTDPDARALVITGAGPSFCAGGDRSDLTASAEGRLANADAFIQIQRETYRLLLELPIPVIAAVSGAAAGVGACYVAVCDQVVLAEDAALWDPHTQYGVPACVPLQVIWPRLMPPMIARELLLTGRKIAAREALAFGLANRVCPIGEALPAALEMANNFSRMPREGLAVTKQLMNQAVLTELALVGAV